VNGSKTAISAEEEEEEGEEEEKEKKKKKNENHFSFRELAPFPWSSSTYTTELSQTTFV
jgi:hypothetical protein